MYNVLFFKLKGKKSRVLVLGCVALFVIILLLGSLICFNYNRNGTLFIRGRVVNNIPIEFDHSEQKLAIPVIEVLMELGYSISPINENSVTVTNDGHVFEVNLEDQTLYEFGGKNLNYLQSPPGSTYRRCCRKGMDIIIDTSTFRSTLYLMDSGYKMIDIPKLKVIVIY